MRKRPRSKPTWPVAEYDTATRTERAAGPSGGAVALRQLPVQASARAPPVHFFGRGVRIWARTRSPCSVTRRSSSPSCTPLSSVCRRVWPRPSSPPRRSAPSSGHPPARRRDGRMATTVRTGLCDPRQRWSRRRLSYRRLRAAGYEGVRRLRDVLRRSHAQGAGCGGRLHRPGDGGALDVLGHRPPCPRHPSAIRLLHGGQVRPDPQRRPGCLGRCGRVRVAGRRYYGSDGARGKQRLAYPEGDPSARTTALGFLDEAMKYAGPYRRAHPASASRRHPEEGWTDHVRISELHSAPWSKAGRKPDFPALRVTLPTRGRSRPKRDRRAAQRSAHRKTTK